MSRRLTLLLTAVALLAAPVGAQEVATAYPGSGPDLSSGGTLGSMLDESLVLLAPALEARQVEVRRTFSADVAASGSRARDVLTTLLMNALSQAPAGGRIEIGYRDGAVSIWIPNASVAYDTARQTSDPTGNAYQVETRAGQGSLYSASL